MNTTTPPSFALSSAESVQLSSTAARRIVQLASKEETPGAMLRITVEGGGCSGFKYIYDFPVWDSTPEDTILHYDEASVLIDPISFDFMKGALIDYVETLGSASFEIKNPNVTASCGCGNSFSV